MRAEMIVRMGEGVRVGRHLGRHVLAAMRCAELPSWVGLDGVTGAGKGAMVVVFERVLGQPGWLRSYPAGRVTESGSVFVCCAVGGVGKYSVLLLMSSGGMAFLLSVSLPRTVVSFIGMESVGQARMGTSRQPTCGMHLLGLLAWIGWLGVCWETVVWYPGCDEIDLFLFALALRGYLGSCGCLSGLFF